VDFNILFVVTNATASKPGKIYSFFRENAFDYLQFIPCIDPAGEKRGGRAFSLGPAEYTHFLKVFFDMWHNDILSGRSVSIRYFDNLVRFVMGMAPETCSMRGVCSCQFVFEADGSCYPCDFYVTEKWKLGNIINKELRDFYESETNQRFLGTSADVAPDCPRCRWRVLCRGGCRRDRENDATGQLGKNYYCSSYSSFFEYAYPKLQEIAEYVRRQFT
jgi:uncharacterized protein